MLSFKEIKELIDLVAQKGLSGLEVEQAGFRVRIEGLRPASANGSGQAGNAPGEGEHGLPERAGAGALEPKVPPPEPPQDKSIHVITSPIVGTFYRSPSPEASAFAEVGQRITRGKILCIIESMKLMNEIESDVDGEILEVYPSNGQPVEYGEKLFAIRLAA